MNRRRRAPSVQPYAGLNLIPLVDMSLNLVLIMLILAPAMYLIRLPVQLPKAKASDSQNSDWLRLSLSQDGRLSLEGEILDSWDVLPEHLKDAMLRLNKNAVLLEVDRRVPYRQTSRLLAQLRNKVLAARIAIGTVPDDERSKQAQ